MTLPNKWANKTLRDLATINYGREPSAILDDTGEYPVYGTSGSERQGTGYHYEGESIILGRKGSIDRLHFAEGRFWAIDTVYFLSDFDDTVPKWLYYLLCSIDLHALNEATGVPSLSRDLLYKISTPTPPLDEQAKIAEVLSTVDRAIEKTETLIAKQQRIKTGLMQDLLTRGIDKHGNLRSEQTHEFKDSPLGRIPAEWSTVKLDELVSRVGSGVTPRGGESVYTPEGVLFIRSQNVHFDGLRLNDVTYIPERTHLSMLQSEIFENDVLLNITGASIGRCCRMPKIDGCANVNQHVCTIRLRSSTEVTAGVLAAVIESHIGQHQIAKFNAGGNREGLNYQQVRSLLLPWPSDNSEFARIYSGIRQMTDRLIASQASLGKLRLLKTGLMQDLLTGNRCVTPLLNQREGVAA